jgi:fido (protein-threonine AMPylation protein)
MDFPVPNTDSQLREWTSGDTAAERLCAGILSLEQFQGIDPQSPFGGPDDGKDLLCEKDGKSFVAAVYFPHRDVTFATTKRKFKDDLKASISHNRDGFIFLSNQHLTISERAELERLAATEGKRCLVYHRERLRVVLDAPQGYGLRLRHLGIALSLEEQFAYFASSSESVLIALREQTRSIELLSERVTRLASAQLGFIAESGAAVARAVRGDDDPTDVATMLQKSAAAIVRGVTAPQQNYLSGQLSTALLRFVHRLTVSPDLLQIAGRYRETQVWVADPTGRVNEDLECPAWDKVPPMMEELVDRWNKGFPELLPKAENKVPTIARFFHRLLFIHPFIDGNGRLARQMLALQTRELLGLQGDIIIDQGVSYYRALRLADTDDFSELEALINRGIKDAI